MTVFCSPLGPSSEQAASTRVLIVYKVNMSISCNVRIHQRVQHPMRKEIIQIAGDALAAQTHGAAAREVHHRRAIN